MSTTNSNDPIAKAYSVPESWIEDPLYNHYKVSWLVPCEFCGRVHVHGNAEGNRHPHCPDKCTYPHLFEERSKPAGYTLKYAGEASPALLERIRRYA